MYLLYFAVIYNGENKHDLKSFLIFQLLLWLHLLVSPGAEGRPVCNHGQKGINSRWRPTWLLYH